MQQMVQEMQLNEAYLNSLISATNDLVFTIDSQYAVVYYNQAMKDYYAGFGINVEKGFNALEFFTNDQKPVFKAYFDKALTGESIELTNHYKIGDMDTYYTASYSPLTTNTGEVTGAAVYAKNVTETILARQEVEKKFEAEKTRNTVIENNREVLLSLNKNEAIHAGEWEKATEEITKVLATQLNTSRASIWQFNAATNTILCLNLFIAATKEYASGTDFPRYFKAVKDEEIIIAPNAHLHEATKEFSQVYLAPLHIESMLDVPYLIDGKLGGVICCENQFAQKHWTIEEVDFLKSVADIITIAQKAAQMQQEKQQVEEVNQKLAASEEELRQNMEEVSATQEKMHQVLAEVQDKELYLNNLINVTGDAIMTIDCNYQIVCFNQCVANTFAAQGIKIEKGMDVFRIMAQEHKPLYKSYYDKVFAGGNLEVTKEIFGHFYNIKYDPLYNVAGEIIGVSIFTRDITQQVSLQKSTEELLSEAQKQAKELKAHEEELHQNMKEMEAIQEELASKNAEIEAVRKLEKERADHQIQAQQKMMERFIEKTKKKEAELLEKIARLQK